MIYLVTVMHSGTRWVRESIQSSCHCAFSHFDRAGVRPEFLDHQLATTNRDKLRVAASWGNREKFRWPLMVRQWREAWEAREQFIQDHNPLIFDVPGGDQHGFTMVENRWDRGDPFRLHKALDEGDLDYFLDYVPLECVEAEVAVL